MFELIDPYLCSFAKGFGFLVLLPLNKFGLGNLSKISFSSLIALFLGPTNDWSLLTLAVNFLCGLVISFPFLAILETIRHCLNVLNFASGQGFQEIYSPSTYTETSPLNEMITLAALWLFTSRLALPSLELLHLDFSGLDFGLSNFGKVLLSFLSELFWALAPILFIFLLIYFAANLGQKALPSLNLMVGTNAVAFLLFLVLLGSWFQPENLRKFLEKFELLVFDFWFELFVITQLNF